MQGHPNLAGLLAVDAGSTQSVGQTVAKYKLRDKGLKVAGGFDLVPETLDAVKAGDLDYTIDQQPYLQGFLPVLALYLYKLSGGLLFPTQTNTGLLFVTKDNVDPYQSPRPGTRARTPRRSWSTAAGRSRTPDRAGRE